jgi:hypothetical protein
MRFVKEHVLFALQRESKMALAGRDLQSLQFDISAQSGEKVVGLGLCVGERAKLACGFNALCSSATRHRLWQLRIRSSVDNFV